MAPRLLDFTFNYRKVHGRDGRTGALETRYYPCVPALLASASRKIPSVEGILDSGSDGNVIPLSMARDLGLELEEAPPMKVVGRMLERFRSRLDITIGRAGRLCDTLHGMEVSIPAEGSAPVIFGRKPIFELFRITFVEAELRFIMEPYSTDIHRKAA